MYTAAQALPRAYSVAFYTDWRCDLFKLVPSERQNSSNKGLVVVARVEGGRGDVVGPRGRIAVLQLVVHREEVHIVHRDVVTAIATHEEPSVQETGSIEPGEHNRHTAVHTGSGTRHATLQCLVLLESKKEDTPSEYTSHFEFNSF